MKQKFTTVAPGRVCLFGDHQDYLGLPVIACAINKYVRLEAIGNDSDTFNILMPDIGQSRVISIHDDFPNLENNDHLGAALRVVRRYGCIPNRGYNLTLQSNIAINAGISSSSAVVIAWTHFLLHAFGCQEPITQELIAQLAYEAEVVEHHSPGGKMDQYTIGLGNIVHIHTGAKFSYETIGNRLQTLIIGESGIPKETIGLLGSLRAKAQEAISQVAHNVPNFDLGSTSEAEIDVHSKHIDKALQPYFYAAIKNHMITQKALLEFKKDILNIGRIGALINGHHEILRDTLKITVPKIDTMVDHALRAGALGVKIVGSGGGGCICALSTDSNKEAVIEGMLKAGAKDAYEVQVSKGTYIE